MPDRERRELTKGQRVGIIWDPMSHGGHMTNLLTEVLILDVQDSDQDYEDEKGEEFYLNVAVASYRILRQQPVDELPGIVQEALRRGESRWDDSSYLARIVFCDMVKGHEAELTGFGIAATIQDNSHLLIVLDTGKQELRFETEGRTVVSRMSFERAASEPLDWPEAGRTST